MFADLELARRIERAEARLTAEVVGAIDDPRALVVALDGGVAAFARPGSPMNKLVGAGLDAPLDEPALAAIEAAFDERGEDVRIELATLADPATLAALARRGYQLHGFENVLGRALDAPAPAGSSPDAIDVARVDDADAAWATTLVDGFAAGDGTGAVVDQHTRDAIEAVMADFARSSARRYVARQGGEVVGAGSARLDHGVAQLCGAATLPASRRRGVQRALLDARLADARAAGCDIAVVTTAPGSQSQANVMRRGFALLYARAILVRPRAR